jgi:hypothetical protein
MQLIEVQPSGCDCLQAAIRLDVFLSPARVAIWEQSVDLPPPSLSGPAFLTTLAALPVSISNTLTIHLLMLPFAHPLPLWPHMLVQAVCVGSVVGGADIRQMCSKPMFRHPTTQGPLGEVFQWLQVLSLFSFIPVSVPFGMAGKQPVTELHCHAVVGWLQVMVGFGVSVAAQAWLDARMFGAFSRRQQRLLEGEALHPDCASHFDKFSDALNRRWLAAGARACKRPELWLLASVAVWDALRVALA